MNAISKIINFFFGQNFPSKIEESKHDEKMQKFQISNYLSLNSLVKKIKKKTSSYNLTAKTSNFLKILQLFLFCYNYDILEK